jgi:hypothetical protein
VGTAVRLGGRVRAQRVAKGASRGCGARTRGHGPPRRPGTAVRRRTARTACARCARARDVVARAASRVPT